MSVIAQFADIGSTRLVGLVAQIEPDEWLEAERRDRGASRARLAEMYAAGPWTALPAIASLPIMAVAGEGDYIIVVLGAMWAVMLALAVGVRRTSEMGSVHRSCATWVASYSALLSITMLAMALAFASDSSWR